MTLMVGLDLKYESLYLVVSTLPINLPTYQPINLPISSSPKLLFIEERRSSRIMILIKISYIVYFQR